MHVDRLFTATEIVMPHLTSLLRLTAADVSLDGTMGVTRGTYEAIMKARVQVRNRLTKLPDTG